jgi:hypothetical protein
MFEKLSRDVRFQFYLAVLSAIAFGFILLATSKYGAGVSSDAARNLSTADSLLSGKGFVDMLGAPLVLWPPLYPLALAALSLLTNLSTFQSAWYLNIFLYVLNVWLSGWLLYLIFRQKPLLAAAGALVMLLSRSTLRIHANVASEPLFETLLLVFFLAGAKYLSDASRVALWIMFAAAGLASLQRYLGVCLIGVAALVVMNKEGARAIRPAAIPFLAALLPITSWAVLHNYPASGTLFGPRDLGAMLPLENVSLSLTKILWWFIPRLEVLDPLLLHPWIPLLGLAVILVSVNRKADWLRWLSALTNVYVWPALVFSVLYFLLLAFTVVTADHLDLTSDRYYVVIFPVVVVLMLITLEELVFVHFKSGRRPVSILLGGIALLWFAYPIYGVRGYIDQALVQGEPTNYNIANSANFREMSVVKAAQTILDKDRSAMVYSNYLNIVWFIYHHPVQALPFENAGLPRAQRLTALQQNYPEWPQASGYIIWFIPNQYHHIAAPGELAAIANLRLLYADKTGEIYYVEAHAH